MNSPYKSKFKVTQTYKGASHDGLDLVGLEDKNIYSTVTGTVERAGWENPLDKNQGFGLYVRIKEQNSANRYYFGHLSSIKVKLGQAVKVGDVLGIEGSTGKSTGSHCHYCARTDASKLKLIDISKISGIPNKIGTYDNIPTTVYIVKKSWKNVTICQTPYISQARNVARRYGYVIYDQNGKTVYSYRKEGYK